MERDRAKQDIEGANKDLNAPDEGDRSRLKGASRSAMTPAAGAAVQHAQAGAELSSEEHASQGGETADALKRAAENDSRV